ncbi:lipoyl synthase [Candidatus Nitromaritima sp. SCGC AAA799-A02]|nr:lipoyl synthase [Candidatus Nitromaritima sp. SCGC AAA799-A02]
MKETTPPSVPVRRLPDWLKASLPRGENYFRLKSLTRKHGLNTVCESASCPNTGSCWDAGTLTLMILGDACSRACRFCDVLTGHMRPPRSEEPTEVARMLSQLGLRYAVITSVDRDDLPDGGAQIWKETIELVKQACPDMKVEALIPDFKGEVALMEKVCDARPDVLAHNLETVESLQAWVRPQCRYSWSLKTIQTAAGKGLITKSSLMLGLGERREEVVNAMRHLVEAGCHILSLGQYLRPSTRHLEVVEYIHPDIFAEYKVIGESLGLAHVESGPLVRSSFHAERQATAAVSSKCLE